MIELRPHHLLCCLTFTGKGYTEEFVKNYYGVIARLQAGEMVRIVSTPDDICQPVCDDPNHHCYNDSIAMRDQLVLDDFNQHTELNLTYGIEIHSSKLFNDDIRQLFSKGVTRNGCARCQWSDICNEEVSTHFSKSIIQMF
ncbi:DUF1284 domain-containing protein [Vibrio sp.]|nr:DUF1284 domain-containing protein [Vibrio sp.]